MKFTWLKDRAPRSLMGRAALILLLPIVTIQLVVGVVFIQRHYENVTRQMTRHVLLDIDYLNDLVASAPGLEAARAAVEPAARRLDIAATVPGDGPLSARIPWYDLPGLVLAETLAEGLPGLVAVDLLQEGRRVAFLVDIPNGPVRYEFPRSRVVASNPHQLLVLMVVVSLLLTLISFLFLKNQVRPIRRLAEAATAFGRGRTVDYRPSGATEVRAAGSAFLDMRNRIERHIEQRTLMLSGVSHDLRTPLTRLKLGLSMLEDDEEARALSGDVNEMEGMIETFLDFARDEATEEPEAVDPVAFAEAAVARAGRGGGAVTVAGAEGAGEVPMRRLAVQRAMDNLIANGLRHGTKVAVSVAVLDRSVRFTVEDDGPGIPAAERENAMKPFTRLDAARSHERGSGVGLGLAIARDVARQHGGTLRLSESARLGGLRVDFVIAR